jgi:hypothetical protein
MLGSYEYCGEDLGRTEPPLTCRRRKDHGSVCSPTHDRGTDKFNDAWAEWFADNPQVLADWGHQNGYMPHGYTETVEIDHG